MSKRWREHLVLADGLRWNVVEAGEGDTVLLVHGTGASVHSWRDVINILSETCHVLAFDLPGHGKTAVTSSRDFALERMGHGIFAVMDVLKCTPVTIAGHSAGAAILTWMSAQKQLAKTFVAFNGAFYPFAGPFASLFSPVAKLMAVNPLLPRILSGVASVAAVERLLRDTGSNISQDGVRLYYELFKNPKHIAGALGMMAAWDLRHIDTWLGRIQTDCLFVTGDNDKAVAPETADRAAARCRNAKVLHMKGFGHLLHEEAPDRAAEIIRGSGA